MALFSYSKESKANRFALTTVSMLLSFMMLFCSNKDLRSEKNILSFQITSPDGTFQIDATINQAKQQITAIIPSEVDITKLRTKISVSPGAQVIPPSGDMVNFKGGVTFTVTAENGSKSNYFVQFKQLSSKNELLTFKLPELSINGEVKENSVEVVFPYGTPLASFKVALEISPKATSSLSSGSSIDFSATNQLTITSEIGTSKVYSIVSIVEPPNQENELESFTLSDFFSEAKIDGNNVSLTLPYGSDLTEVLVDIVHSEKSTSSITNNSQVNLNEVTEVVITSESGKKNVYNINITIQEQEEGIRGVWLTNVASNVLDSRENIARAMQLLSELNFNTVFVVAWNKTQTPHPSDVLNEILEPLEDQDFETRFDPDRDVLQEVIEEAHARDLKVIAWFEYGFASQYGATDGGRNTILKAHSDWESQDVDGNIASKNNFYWMNAFHPEVQQFITDLIVEVVENYDVDGIQGDDRLPAVTSTSGYDTFTVEKYKAENNGENPPKSSTNSKWLKWRSNILSDYAEKLYHAVKEVDPNCLVTFSPSPYPFAYTQYCQDWPTWIERGVVDVISPQLYRRDRNGLNVYKHLFNTNLAYAENNRSIYYPGVLLRIDNYVPSDEYLVEVIRFHREKEVNGEVFFFFEGVKVKRKVFEAIYPGPALFPDFSE